MIYRLRGKGREITRGVLSVIINGLIKALRDKDKVVCYLARKALVNMLGVDFGYDYKMWEKFWKEVKVKGLFG
jgi:hypothetical protein